MADQTDRIHQISLLAKEIGLVIPDFDKVLYPDWETLFIALNHRTQNRFTLCLDEFPYLVKSSPELPALLQKMIDSRLLKYNLIICGSSQQLMQGLVLDGSAPLYGRADQMLKLPPARSMDGKKLLLGECKWTEGEDTDRLSYELMEKARKLPFLKGEEIVPVLFLKRNPIHGNNAFVMTPQQIIDSIG